MFSGQRKMYYQPQKKTIHMGFLMQRGRRGRQIVLSERLSSGGEATIKAFEIVLWPPKGMAFNYFLQPRNVYFYLVGHVTC